jgi:hypothetical protein
MDIAKVQEKIDMIKRQTDCTDDVEIFQKLIEMEDDHIRVIKFYLGITTAPNKTKKTVNQEIYAQIRHKMDISMKKYNADQYVKLEQDLNIASSSSSSS